MKDKLQMLLAFMFLSLIGFALGAFTFGTWFLIIISYAIGLLSQGRELLREIFTARNGYIALGVLAYTFVLIMIVR